MRYIILLVVFFSCMEERLTDCNFHCFKMTISDGIPIQFWLNGEPTFNESNPICGLTPGCFCQPLNCTDEVKIQIQDDTGSLFRLVVFDSDDSELTSIGFEEVAEDIFQVEFTPTELDICNQIVKFEIIAVDFQTWELQTSAADNNWRGIAYGNGIFAAISSSGTGNRIMTSIDGSTWVSQTSAADNAWQSITFGNGLFVAVATTGTGNRVMTSADGVTWATQTSAADIQWIDVTFGNGLFVAVANSGTTNRVMTSTNGTVWTIRVTPNNDFWSIAYGNGVYTALGNNAAMHSTDGITWDSDTPPTASIYYSIAYGNDIFVAVGDVGIATSVDGENWVVQTSSNPASLLRSVAFGNGIFIALPNSGDDIGVFSIDGINWSNTSLTGAQSWEALVYGDGLFVGVSDSGTGTRVITSGLSEDAAATSDCIDIRNNHQCSKLISYTNADDFDGIIYDISPQPTFYLRVPAQLLEDENPQTQEDLELSNGTIVTIRQTIQEKSIFKLGYMPPYMHTKVQKVLMHDTAVIDDVQWKRRDAYEAPRIEDYPLKKGEVLLTKYNSVLKNTI